MQKKKESEGKKNKKLNEIYDFINKLKHEKKLKLTVREFEREIILFFGAVDPRVIEAKKRVMNTLGLVEFDRSTPTLVKEGAEIVWIKKKF